MFEPDVLTWGFSIWLFSPTPVWALDVDFTRDIRPLLSDRCFACHGPDEEQRQADLRLDDLSQLEGESGSQSLLIAGDPENSGLFLRLASHDPNEVMPPPGSTEALDADELALFREWIKAGADWNRHWAYDRPRPSRTPATSAQRHQMQNWIDGYVLQELEARGASLSPRADFVTLLRRISFDVTGLPPRIDDLEALAATDAGDALQDYVDRLLASPAFGERLAAYWLDLVRYADTVGYHGDQDHNISPYRDYVVNSLNDGKPFNEFSIEQLAGDLLDDPTSEQIVATGYNRLLQTSHEGGVQVAEYLTIYQADRVRNLSAVWLGATVGCAQCHDHKYDPFTSRDFYALAAFFADIDEAQHFKVGTNALPTKRPPEIAVLSRGQRSLQRKLLGQRAQLISERGLETGLQVADPRGPKVKQATEVPPSPLPLQARRELAELDRQLEQLEQEARLTMVTVSIAPREVRFLPRGNWLDDSGPVMTPAVPEFMRTAGDMGQTQASTLQGRSRSSSTQVHMAERPANRRQLAEWLVNAEDGVGLLTARVFVNRLWMLFFGRGLSPTVDDFGGQGEPPSHPQLLDRLACELVDSGWDIKHVVRLILGSATYQQASLETDWQRAHDPLNRWLSRQSRFRLPAEMIRDAALQAGDLLVLQNGGQSVRPYQPSGYYRHLNFPTRSYQASEDDQQWRRGLYMHWQRQFLHPMLRALDAPMREECTAQRTRSNTPLAALVLLNDPTLVEAARGLALRCGATTDGDQARIARMTKIVLSRNPDGFEADRLLQLLNEARKHYQNRQPDAEALLRVGNWESNSRLTTPQDVREAAAWVTVARAVLNLGEATTRY